MTTRRKPKPTDFTNCETDGCPCWEAGLARRVIDATDACRLMALRARVAELERQITSHRCGHALDEALNSGDGSYKP